MATLLNRFKEPSSWAGIAVLLQIGLPLVGLPVAGADAIVQAGAALAAAGAVFLKERG